MTVVMMTMAVMMVINSDGDKVTVRSLCFSLTHHYNQHDNFHNFDADDDGDLCDDHERNVREVMFDFDSDSGRPSFSYQSFVCFRPIVHPLNVTSHIVKMMMMMI